MKVRQFRHRFVRAVMAIAIGGSAFQLGGCDPDVRDALVAGLESTALGLSTALISAFFLSVDSDEQ